MAVYLEFLSGRDFIQNPYPDYERYLSSDNPCWLKHPINSDTPGIWLFSRYDDVTKLLRLPSDLITKQISRAIPNVSLGPLDLTLINLDPPDHSLLRTLCANAFDSARVRTLLPNITDKVNNLIDQLLIQGGGDFISEFAIQLPVSIISEIMNVPNYDRAQLLHWVAKIVKGTDSSNINQTIINDQQHAFSMLLEYFEILLKERRKSLGDDLISELLVGIEQSDQRISMKVLRNTCAFLLVTGYETTVAALGTGMYTLLNEPIQLKKLRESSDLIPSAVEEMLRYETPLQRSTFRAVTRDCVIGGKSLQAGDQIGAIIGAANRDPRIFINPNQFLIDRKPNRHLAFGSGIHVCLGALLARSELRIAFACILQKLPSFQLAGTATWNNNTLIRSLASLPIVLK